MSSDHPFYQFMQQFPKQMFDILGISDIYREDYMFYSPVVKQSEYRADGFYRGKNLPLPMVFIELNLYKPHNIHLKTLAEAWMIYEQTPDRPDEFYVFILFDSRKNDPGRTPFVEACMPQPYFQVIYLDEILNLLPQNPYFTLLSLMVSKDGLDQDISRVKNALKNIDSSQTKFLDLCLILLSSKYRTLHLNDLYAMFPTFKDELKESLAIQELLAEMSAERDKLVTEQVTQQVTHTNSTTFAKNLILNSDFSAEKIAQLTGLPLDEVIALCKEIKPI